MSTARSAVAGLLISVALCLPGQAFVRGGGGSASPTGWSILPIGAGANVNGISIANDNTMFVRMDTGGAARWDAAGTSPVGTTGTWTFVTGDSNYPDPLKSNPINYNSGVYEIVVAPNNSSIVYMTAPFWSTGGTAPVQLSVYKSTDQGNTFAATGFTAYADNNYSNTFPLKQYGQKMAVDPNNSSNLLVGTPLNGLFYTSNAGTSFSTVAGPATPTDKSGYSGIQFNPQNSSEIFVYSWGNGTYHTTGGPAGTWAKLTAGTGPVGVVQAAIDIGVSPITYAGRYYALDSNGDFWVWTGSTWSKTITGQSLSGVVADPQQGGRVIAITHNGALAESTDGGSTWSAFTNGTPTLSGTGDVPWIADNAILTLGLVSAVFDHSNNHLIHGVATQGKWSATWTGTIGSGTTVNWNAQSRGIEELVGQDVVSPASGVVIASAWDFGAFYKAYPFTTYPTVPTTNQNNSFGFGAAWSVSYAPGAPLNVAMLSDGAYASFGQTNQRSTDGGQTWSSFTPPDTSSNGNIAVSTATNAIVSRPGSGSSGLLAYTTNFGASPTWNTITLPGSPSLSGIGDGPFGIGGRWLERDQVNSGQFTLMLNSVGFYTTTNGGAVWTAYANTNAGKGNASTSAAQSKIKSVPGQANHLWWVGGTWGGANVQPPTLGNTSFKALQYSTTATSDLTATGWTTVTNVTQCTAVGFGAPAPGQSYPSVYIAGAWVSSAITGTVSFATGPQNITLSGNVSTFNVGAAMSFYNGASQMVGIVTLWNAGTQVLSVNIAQVVSGTGSVSSGTVEVYGIFRSIAGPSATPAWTQLGVWPANSIDDHTNITGDMSNYGRVYGSHGGTGFFWGYFNFLLKRDLDPASNDNDPMWLEKAA